MAIDVFVSLFRCLCLTSLSARIILEAYSDLNRHTKCCYDINCG